MPEAPGDVLKRGMMNTIKSMSRIQQEKNKMMMNMIESDYKMGGSLMAQMLKSQMDIKQKKQLAPFELEQKGKEKLLPSAPSMTYKDTIFQEIRKKPQEQWEGWEKQFMGSYAGKKSPTAPERKILGEIRTLKNKNASLEDIQTYIKESGYELEDFNEELKEYSPISKKKFWLW